MRVSVPFSATGAVALLLITGTPLGVAALIGALMLVGVVATLRRAEATPVGPVDRGQ
ncbi:hypothetical protein [Ruania rhizosphaerae]|uniref:hypothetical protein n=1 Tax=Ruania rhizosphaerae TaxID=1840413 RepID=UPI00135BBC76|nr:hypothetical protein [Ruania rhizosphaerae]